jgi:Flp pilus assembly pilin Flp
MRVQYNAAKPAVAVAAAIPLGIVHLDSFRTWRRDERGQNVVDYGLMMALVVFVVLVGVNTFGQQLLPWLTRLSGLVTTIGT